MASLVRVSDPHDVRLRDYLHLTDVQLRSRLEPAEGIFLAEGDKVIRRALDAGYPLRSMLLAEKWLPGLADVVAGAAEDLPVLVAPDDLLEAVTGFAVHRGALASLARVPLPAPEAVLATAKRVVVLEDVNNHTNIGVIFRAAAALGMDAVLLNPRCADPLYRRSVKVAMGAVFSLPYARFEHWPQGLDSIRQAGLQLLALTPADDAVPIGALDATTRERCALMFGAEGDGLSPAALAAADASVRIPMAHGVDSLNVGAAAAVAFYAVTLTAGTMPAGTGTTPPD